MGGARRRAGEEEAVGLAQEKRGLYLQHGQPRGDARRVEGAAGVHHPELEPRVERGQPGVRAGGDNGRAGDAVLRECVPTSSQRPSTQLYLCLEETAPTARPSPLNQGRRSRSNRTRTGFRLGYGNGLCGMERWSEVPTTGPTVPGHIVDAAVECCGERKIGPRPIPHGLGQLV